MHSQNPQGPAPGLMPYVGSRNLARARIRAGINTFKRDEHGAIAMIFALTFMCVILIMGVAVDYGRASQEKTHAQYALDAATLAYVRAYVTNHDTKLSSDTLKAFADNNKSGWEWVVDTFNTNSTTINILASGTTTYPTTFMRIFGIESLDLHVNSSASAYIPSTSISIAADISWTMRGTRMTALQDALKKFSASLYDMNSLYEQRMVTHLVPFADSVNVGRYTASYDLIKNWNFTPDAAWKTIRAQHYKVLDTSLTTKNILSINKPVVGYPTTRDVSYSLVAGTWVATSTVWASAPWSGCLQTNPNDFTTEGVPAAQSRLPYPAVNYNNFLFCPAANTSLLAGITNKSDFDTAVDSMQIYWGTGHNAGLLWAKRTLSPDWASFFGIESRPWNDDKLYPKYVVMLSDGDTAIGYSFGGDQAGKTRPTPKPRPAVSAPT